MKKQTKTLLIVVASVLAIVFAIVLLRNRQLPLDEEVRIYIPSEASYAQVVDTLVAHSCIADVAAFKAMADCYGYPKHVKGGSYLIKPDSSPLKLVRKLKSGSQDPIRITINKHRTKERLCSFLASKLELSSDTLLAMLSDSAVCASFGYTPQTILCMFVQNTYEVYWNTTPQRLLERMAKESDRFWNALRRGQCEDLGLTAEDVITLASIVEEETNKNDEKPLVASVYLNRLHKGMPLQADPTVKYAVGDPTLQRILNRHVKTPSPYNTYLNTGLPPGPICIPSVASIDAVLQNFKSNYLYFCAKEDFSGYHNFATTLSQHQQNATRFHRALDSRGIR